LKTPVPLLTAEPELHKVEVGKDDLYVVLACDGVWDVMSDQDVCDVVSKQFGAPREAAKEVLREAYARKSEDNLTATVIQFEWQSGRVEEVLAAYEHRKETEREKARLAALEEEEDMFA
jgi:serine/threonine protein phosphatase PrpC